jgi:AraC-like DNA-binding protein
MRSKYTIFSENFFQRFPDTFSPYMESVGIDLQVLERADIEIPEERYIALWEAASRSNQNVGLEIGSQTEANDIGALGYALRCAPSVEKALETMHQFVVVFSQKSRIDFVVDAWEVRVDYQINDPLIIYRRQDAEFAIATILRQLNLITDNRMKPVRVDFEHDKPTDTSVHKTLFGCALYFNQPTNRLYFSSDVLTLPVEQSNERLYQALEPYLQRQREERTEPDQLLPRITKIIAADLSSGVTSLDVISEQFGVSRRTLQRRLQQEGVKFSTLIEEVRRELALAYITDSDYSVTEISILVGYSESGSFSRAFHRWTGQAPLEYREKKC